MLEQFYSVKMQVTLYNLLESNLLSRLEPAICVDSCKANIVILLLHSALICKLMPSLCKLTPPADRAEMKVGGRSV